MLGLALQDLRVLQGQQARQVPAELQAPLGPILQFRDLPAPAAHTHNITAYTHSVTNNAVTSGNPSATLTHSVTQPSAHTDLSVVQPYIVVYMFKRTA